METVRIITDRREMEELVEKHDVFYAFHFERLHLALAMNEMSKLRGQTFKIPEEQRVRHYETIKSHIDAIVNRDRTVMNYKEEWEEFLARRLNSMHHRVAELVELERNLKEETATDDERIIIDFGADFVEICNRANILIKRLKTSVTEKFAKIKNKIGKKEKKEVVEKPTTLN
ncbi:unnamed protein product [Caenorhabditis nigoni]